MSKIFSQFWAEAWDNYHKMQKEFKDCERVSPKEYGEYLQKKRKRGKRKK